MFYLAIQCALISLSLAAAPSEYYTTESDAVTSTASTEHSTTVGTTVVQPVTRTKRVTEYPRNDDGMVDRTIYVNRIDEALIVLKREIEVYVRKGNATNYSLVVFEENVKFRSLGTISELFSKTLANGTLGLDFNQKLLLHNKVLHQFELWWMIRSCSILASNFVNKCRVVDLESKDILVNAPTAEVPKTFLIQNNRSSSFTKITGISADVIECYCEEHSRIVKCLTCYNVTSVKYFLFTINSTASLQLFSHSSNSPDSIRFEVLDVSQVISIDPLNQTRKVYINVNLDHDVTSLLFEFTSRGTSNKPSIYFINCSTYDGRNGKKGDLCELTTRNIPLHGRKMTKLRPRENIIMNIKTARSASYLLTYSFFLADGSETETQVKRVVELETFDMRYMGSACFNESLEGCVKSVSYPTQLGNTSSDGSNVLQDVKAEQTIVVCDFSITPVILCTPRVMTEERRPSQIEHVPRDKYPVILLGILCGSVVILCIGAGCVVYRLRKLQLERKCVYHTYVKPDCEMPSLEVDYTGIEILYSDP